MHYRPSFFSIGGSPTMTSKDPTTCSFPSQTKLRRGDVEMVKRMYGCSGGANLYLPIKQVSDGSHCAPNFKLPGDVSYKTGSYVDLTKLTNVPYGKSLKYIINYGGFGIAASTPFVGHIDANNQGLIGITSDDVGVLKFSNIQVPGWYGSGSWGTSIWIEVRSQCQPSGSCESGTQHVWKFEKTLNPEEAEEFAFTHVDPSLASSSVAGAPVVLQYLGLVPCGAGSPGGSSLYLKIQGINAGSHCTPGFKLPGDSSYKTGFAVDLNKLMNNPYGSSYRYWVQFGGFGVAASTGFDGCIDDNNQGLIETTSAGLGILKFPNVQVH